MLQYDSCDDTATVNKWTIILELYSSCVDNKYSTDSVCYWIEIG